MTLGDTAVFLAGAFLVGALEVTLTAGFFVFATTLAGAAFLVAGFALAAVFFEATLATVARLAFTFEAGFAFTARFAAFEEEVFFAAVRAVDRRKPFERLLLICF
ncbi:MAG TPA: hypothetical protein VI306_09400 [Pyrinomonadaceae bacterium]